MPVWFVKFGHSSLKAQIFWIDPFPIRKLTTRMSVEARPLILFAVPEEAAPFRKRVGEGTSPRIAVTGMGAVNARRTLDEALAVESPSYVITSGFAGALNPDLSTGDVLWNADEDFPLLEEERSKLGRPSSFLCAERVLVSREEKSAAYKKTGCDAVDMESGVIRSMCREKGIPSMTLRIVSDAALEDMPLDFNKIVNERMEVSGLRIAWQVLTHFWRIPALIRFQGVVKRCSDELAVVLEKACSSG